MNSLDSLWVSSTDAQLDCLSNSVDSLQNGLSVLQYKTDLLSSILETSNDSISNQLSAAGYLLALIAVVIAVVSIVLGYYIHNRKKEIEAIGNTIEEKKIAMERIEKETKELDERIHCNLKDLYQELRKEETDALIDRLVLEPLDISNLIKLLLAREVDDNNFGKLKEAYLKIKDTIEVEYLGDDGHTYVESYRGYKNNYLLLFFQHYCFQALQDDTMRPELVKRFGLACRQAFKRDIIKSTIDLCRALSDDNSTFNKEDVLVAYLKALNGSKHRGYEELKNILEQNIKPNEILANSIERCTNEKVYLTLFGVTPVAPEDEMQPES